MRNYALYISAVFLTVVISISSLLAETGTTDTVALGVNWLKKLEDKHQETRTFTGEFDQLMKSELFLEEIESEGKFWYEKPGRFRCEYEPPNEQVNLVVDDLAYVYIPEIKQVEIYHFDRGESGVKRINRMLLGFGISVEEVLDVYEVRFVPEEETENTVSLYFKPRKEGQGVDFKAAKLWVDKKSLLPQKLVFLQEGGDKTIITLKDIKFNKKIKQSLFKPDFPRDAEVIEQY